MTDRTKTICPPISDLGGIKIILMKLHFITCIPPNPSTRAPARVVIIHVHVLTTLVYPSLVINTIYAVCLMYTQDYRKRFTKMCCIFPIWVIYDHALAQKPLPRGWGGGSVVGIMRLISQIWFTLHDQDNRRKFSKKSKNATYDLYSHALAQEYLPRRSRK